MVVLGGGCHGNEVQVRCWSALLLMLGLDYFGQVFYGLGSLLLIAHLLRSAESSGRALYMSIWFFCGIDTFVVSLLTRKMRRLFMSGPSLRP